MILDINKTMNSFATTIGNPINKVMQAFGHLASRAVHQLHQNYNAAVVVCVVSNYALITLANNFERSIHQHTEKYFVNLTEKQKIVKDFLLKGTVLGSSAAVFNTILSKATQHPLSRNVLIVIVVGTIAARTILKEAVTRYNEYLELKKNSIAAKSLVEKEKADKLEDSHKYDDAQIEIDSLSGSLEEAEIKIKTLQEELAQAQGNAIPKQSEIESQQIALKEIQIKYEEAKSKINLLTEALESASKKEAASGGDLENDLHALSDSRDQKKLSTEVLNNDYVVEVEKLKSDIESLQLELKALKQEREETVNNLEGYITDLEELNTGLKGEVDRLNDSIAEKDIAIGHLQEAGEENNAESSDLKAELEKLQANFDLAVAGKNGYEETIHTLEIWLRNYAKKDVEGGEPPSVIEQVEKMAAHRDQLLKSLESITVQKSVVEQEFADLKATTALNQSQVQEDHSEGKDSKGTAQKRTSLLKTVTSFKMGKTPKKESGTSQADGKTGTGNSGTVKQEIKL